MKGMEKEIVERLAERMRESIIWRVLFISCMSV